MLVWFAIQASALPLLALACEQDPSSMHAHAAVHDHDGDRDAHHHGDGGDSSSPGNSHTCCHNLSSAALPALTVTADLPASGADPTPLFYPSSFFPEQPLPPPLAA